MSDSPPLAHYCPRDRAWWRRESVGTGTDWSSLLRQRVRVLAWVRAGRPPIAAWTRQQGELAP